MIKRLKRFNRLTGLVLVVLVAAIGFIIFMSRATTPPGNDRFGMNTLQVMNGNNTQVGAIFDQMNAEGVGWVREDFEWSGIEPARGSFTWSKLDVAVNQATAHHIKILATLDYTPAWARTNQSSDHYPPDDPNDYAAFAAATVMRYHDRVHDWEIWNEPNNSEFWLPNPDVAAYTTLLQKAYAAIKGVDPTATVMVGGLTVGSGNDLAPTFLQAIYDHNGGTSTGLFDAVAWHPYCSAIDPITSTDSWCVWYQMNGSSPSGRSIMVAHGDASKQIWPTEYGVSTGGTGGQATDQATQAADLTDAYTGAGSLPYLGPLFWYDWQDTGVDNTFFSFYGLESSSGLAKPAWDSYRNLAFGGSGTIGDLNGDGHVNVSDLSILAQNYAAMNATESQGDLNGDGLVNISDFSIIASHWTGG